MITYNNGFRFIPTEPEGFYEKNFCEGELSSILLRQRLIEKGIKLNKELRK